MRAVLVAAFAVATAACVGAMPSGSDGTGGNGPAQAAVPDAAAGSAPDLGAPADLAHPPLPDLGSTDLAGLVNCFGVTVCDPSTTFCIRFNAGSPAAPGAPSAPACYEPVDCMGANMNCDCITQDPVLGPSCASCADHMDGTYDCYAQP